MRPFEGDAPAGFSPNETQRNSGTRDPSAAQSRLRRSRVAAAKAIHVCSPQSGVHAQKTPTPTEKPISRGVECSLSRPRKELFGKLLLARAPGAPVVLEAWRQGPSYVGRTVPARRLPGSSSASDPQVSSNLALHGIHVVAIPSVTIDESLRRVLAFISRRPSVERPPGR